MIPALQAGRFDGINTGMFWTEERSKIAYTVPYAQQTISLAVTKGSAAEARQRRTRWPDARRAWK